MTGTQPCDGMVSCPFSFTFSMLMLCGDGPLPFKPYSESFVHTSAKASPPIPFEVGSTTVRQAAVAIAASMAFPPFFIRFEDKFFSPSIDGARHQLGKTFALRNIIPEKRGKCRKIMNE
ncbi:Uncharacterised protein [Mycobacteroides abscessus subsp. abscessus]|nr:Uncharacterised protein [Mycobacteroides abscessus subsp. abscessus]